MNNKSRVAILTCVFLIIPVLIIFLSIFTSAPSPTISYTPISRTSCLNKDCKAVTHIKTRYAQNSLGEWVDAADVLYITKHQDDITFHYNGIKGYKNLTLEAGAIYNGS